MNINYRESTDRSLDKEFVGPDDVGYASTDNEDADTEPQGARPKKARKANKEPAQTQEAPCLYCGRLFKGEKGVLRHEKFCQKKKEMG